MRSARFSGRFYFGAAIFLAIVILAVFGPMVFNGHQPSQQVGGLYDPPSSNAWLGTDNIGHDVFANLMYGARTSLETDYDNHLCRTHYTVRRLDPTQTRPSVRNNVGYQAVAR